VSKQQLRATKAAHSSLCIVVISSKKVQSGTFCTNWLLANFYWFVTILVTTLVFIGQARKGNSRKEHSSEHSFWNKTLSA
jgi:hypothetical protein